MDIVYSLFAICSGSLYNSYERAYKSDKSFDKIMYVHKIIQLFVHLSRSAK